MMRIFFIKKYGAKIIVKKEELLNLNHIKFVKNQVTPTPTNFYIFIRKLLKFELYYGQINQLTQYYIAKSATDFFK